MRLFKRKGKDDEIKNEKLELPPKITKIFKSGDEFELKPGEDTIVELITPIGVDTGIINTSYKSKRGDIYEFEALVDFKKGEVIKIKGKIVRYGPFLKRLPSKIFICLCSLAIGEILIYYFAIGKLIYYIIGIIITQLFDEILIRIKDKNYEKSRSIEIIKRN